jgi:predicted oxidoreductase
VILFVNIRKQKPRKPARLLDFFGGDKRDRTADLLNAIQEGFEQYQWFAVHLMAIRWQ